MSSKGRILALALIVLAGCADLQAPVQPPAGTAKSSIDGRILENQLREQVSIAGGSEGTRAFLLPRSHDFAAIPQDPKNPLSDDKVRLGQMLYHETALAVNCLRPEGEGTYSCASCHHAQGGFMANLPQGIGEGGSGFGAAGEGRTFQSQYDPQTSPPDCQPIRTPTVLNAAYQELQLWNGQFGGVGGNLGTEDRWTAGTPLESNRLGLHGLETQAHAGMAVHRMAEVSSSIVATLPRYRALFTHAFPADPEPISRLNVALAIAAYERTLLASEAPFQKWLRGNPSALTPVEKEGALLFFGKAGCVACHQGPALNSMGFHALGMNDLDGSCDPARVNLTPFGGTVPETTRKGRGGFTGLPEDDFKFKTPQLYNLADSPFYGHGASFFSVRQVVEYKNAAVPQNALVPATQIDPLFQPLGLQPQEIDALVEFLEKSLYDGRLLRYLPQRLPSGNCFPVNDPQAQDDLGCRGTGPS